MFRKNAHKNHISTLQAALMFIKMPMTCKRTSNNPDATTTHSKKSALVRIGPFYKKSSPSTGKPVGPLALEPLQNPT